MLGVLLNPLAVVCECTLDYINNRCTIRNEQRTEKQDHEGNVSDDKTIMGMEDYIAMTVPPGRVVSPGQDLPLQVVTPITQHLMTTLPSIPHKYIFMDEDAQKNDQVPMQNTILDALLEMF